MPERRAISGACADARSAKPRFVFWKRIESRISKTTTTARTTSFNGEKTSVEPLIVNPLFEIGGTIRRSCPPQIMLITARITPSSPSVAIIGATPAIGPDDACLTNDLIRINSTSAAKIAPPTMATGSAIQNDPRRETAS